MTDQRTAQDPHATHPESLGFCRVAAASLVLKTGDVEGNRKELLASANELAGKGVRLAVFPELCLTGYSCGDLFHQEILLSGSFTQLRLLAHETASFPLAMVVGLPVAVSGRIFNCAAFVCGGRILGLVPKTHLPTGHEFYEARWFAGARDLPCAFLPTEEGPIPIGTDLIFSAEPVHPGLVVGIEVCEDLWTVTPPSGDLALAGATILANPSASNEVLGKASYRRELVRQQSARCLAAYIYAGAGGGESTTDLVYPGHSMVAENGHLLDETKLHSLTHTYACTDIDLDRLQHERWTNTSFRHQPPPQRQWRRIAFTFPGSTSSHRELLRTIVPHPFVPADSSRRAEHCRDIFAMQSAALARRLRHIGTRRCVIGISGGLDSTLALLVTVKAFHMLDLPLEGILAVTLPGHGTTRRTHQNATELIHALGASFREIDIRAAVDLHLSDISHPKGKHDVTFENAQARERTQILMDLANQVGGIVIGTGDLSEAALGWCTFNGDHMSMYHVNAGVPKTLVRYLVEWTAEHEVEDKARTILLDIADTPITPELLPIGQDGSLQQKTEDTIGPYELHDFFLFHLLRHGARPAKIFFLATIAFRDKYPKAEILRWMDVFHHRFFAQQFKRNSMPDGPKIGSVALSPRGDWRMPSDADASLWRTEIARLSQDSPS